MLIKGGSSFNALVRAMKQDLVGAVGSGGGGRTTNPALLYEIDKLSLDRVQVSAQPTQRVLMCVVPYG